MFFKEGAMDYEITRVSSKGQVVIPAGLRKKIGLTRGSKILLLAEGPNLLMRVVTPPEIGVFAKLIAKSFSMLKEGGKEYKALWNALKRHSISDVYRNI